jgi:hypothetical protein
MTETPTVSFVIPVRNDAIRLARCLTSIWTVPSQARVDIVVADNGSTDASADVARHAGARVLFLPNLPVSELRNRAAAASEGRILAFVDADHELRAGWVDTAVEVLAGDGVGAAGALYLSPPHPTWVQRMYGALRGTTLGQSEARWLGSGNLAVKREAFDAIRGFDSSLTACEDVDLCQRLRGAGWHVLGDERLGSIHYGDPATLGALFRAERWRGRDNLRVTLRGAVNARDWASAIIPIAEFALVLVGLLATATAPWIGDARPVALGAWLVVLGLVSLRATALATRLHQRGAREFLRAWVVSAVYDCARAAALVTRASHHGRGAKAPVAPASPA